MKHNSEMPEVAHTPEPWQADHSTIWSTERHVANFCGGMKDWQVGVANAKRAVLAVNSTKGISNEALESTSIHDVLKELVEASKSVVQDEQSFESQNGLAAQILSNINSRLRNAIEQSEKLLGGDSQ